MNSLHGKNIGSTSVGTSDTYVKYGPAKVGLSIENMSIYASLEVLSISNDNTTTSLEIRGDVNIVYIGALALVCVGIAYAPELIGFAALHAMN